MRTLPNGLMVESLNRYETDYLYRQIFVESVYGSRESLNLPPSPLVVDVGANIGMFALFAKHHWPAARIFAFEPIHDVFEALLKNVGNFPGSMTFNVALGDAREQRRMTFYPRFSIMSGFLADPDSDRAVARSYIEQLALELPPIQREILLDGADDLLEGRFSPTSITCDVERLADITAIHGLERIDLLKVDVEGHELAVLNGIGSVWPMIDRVVVEVDARAQTTDTIVDLLHAHDLRTEIRPVRHSGAEVMCIVSAFRSDLQR